MDDEKVEKLYESLVAQHTRMQQTIEALRAALDKQPTKGAQTKRLIAHWCETWGARYQDRYVLTPGKDAARLSKMLDTMPVEEAQRRISAFLATNEPFYVRARHPLAMFDPNRWVQANHAQVLTLEAPSDCQHVPPCKNDVAHTKRMTQEARTV